MRIINKMIYNLVSKAIYAWNVSGILNLCINSGKDTVVTGPKNSDSKISEYLCMNSGQDIITGYGEDISMYDLGLCYVTGFHTVSCFQYQIPVIKEIFKKPGVIQFRYWGVWIPGLGVYKKIYYINAMTD
jgi:hypothetical protein